MPGKTALSSYLALQKAIFPQNWSKYIYMLVHSDEQNHDTSMNILDYLGIITVTSTGASLIRKNTTPHYMNVTAEITFNVYSSFLQVL